MIEKTLVPISGKVSLPMLLAGLREGKPRRLGTSVFSITHFYLQTGKHNNTILMMTKILTTIMTLRMAF